jgi:hypothetical protein
MVVAVRATYTVHFRGGPLYTVLRLWPTDGHSKRCAICGGHGLAHRQKARTEPQEDNNVYSGTTEPRNVDLSRYC